MRAHPPPVGKWRRRGGGNTPLNFRTHFPFPLTPVNLLGCTLPFAYIGPTVRSGGLGGNWNTPCTTRGPLQARYTQESHTLLPLENWKSGKVPHKSLPHNKLHFSTHWKSVIPYQGTSYSKLFHFSFKGRGGRQVPLRAPAKHRS